MPRARRVVFSSVGSSQKAELLAHNDDEEAATRPNESYKQFFRRESPLATPSDLVGSDWRALGHCSNLIAFVVEDWCMSALLGFIAAALSISVDVSYEYLNHCESAPQAAPASRQLRSSRPLQASRQL